MGIFFLTFYSWKAYRSLNEAELLLKKASLIRFFIEARTPLCKNTWHWQFNLNEYFNNHLLTDMGIKIRRKYYNTTKLLNYESFSFKRQASQSRIRFFIEAGVTGTALCKHTWHWHFCYGQIKTDILKLLSLNNS